jgi:hypothetical protein
LLTSTTFGPVLGTCPWMLYICLFIFFLENTMVHTKVTPRKTKEVQLMASCKLCSRDFTNEEQLRCHHLPDYPRLMIPYQTLHFFC